MPEDLSIQMLSQTSDNIKTLFETITRIDERVKVIQSQHELTEEHILNINNQHVTILQKLVVLEHQQSAADGSLPRQINDCVEAIRDLDKRLVSIERDKGRSDDRWNKITTFVIQLIWVVLAAYVLTKLQLQSPAIP